MKSLIKIAFLLDKNGNPMNGGGQSGSNTASASPILSHKGDPITSQKSPSSGGALIRHPTANNRKTTSAPKAPDVAPASNSAIPNKTQSKSNNNTAATTTQPSKPVLSSGLSGKHKAMIGGGLALGLGASAYAIHKRNKRKREQQESR